MEKFEYYKEALKNYAVFSGRANRAQYWYFVLFNILIAFAFGLVDSLIFGSDSNMGMLNGLYSLFVFVPSIAIAIRRLHDIGKSGWNLLFVFIPVIGFFIVLYFLIKPSASGYSVTEAEVVSESKPKTKSEKVKKV